ncbi:MAG TPA: TetR/AcrR family transcriptional regulator [Iamia sp.]|nr:TetR/AcrR family transcriptional regulator [Iamia sp.]
MSGADAVAPRRRGRPRSRARSGSDDDPREAIVAAASALFAAHGVEGVTMAQIAEGSGLQQSSIYYWFRSKSDILASILERVNRVPLSIVERERTAAGPLAERLHRLVREDVLTLCGFPFDINEIHRLARRAPEEFTAYWEERRHLDDQVEAMVAEGVASGELRPVDPRLAARSLLAADEATQNWFRPLGTSGYTAEEVADHIATTAVRSLLPD